VMLFIHSFRAECALLAHT